MKSFFLFLLMGAKDLCWVFVLGEISAFCTKRKEGVGPRESPVYMRGIVCVVGDGC